MSKYPFKYDDTCKPPAKGSVLVLVLIIVSSMTILAIGLAYRTRIELRLAKAYANRTYVHYLALGGIERTTAHLGRQVPPDITLASDVAALCTFNTTATAEGLFDGVSDEFSEGQLLSYAIRDEQAHLNLNRSDPASWANIEIVNRERQASILDWLDADDDANPDGAERNYYERQEPPYVTKNGPIVALKELLYVRGVSPNIYLGEDRNRNSLLDDNERDGQRQRPMDNRDSNLDPGLMDVFTVYGSGKVNINTAPSRILAALPGLDETAADAIVTHRAGYDGRVGTDDDIYCETAEDLSKIQGLTELQTELLEQYCSFYSEHFRVFSYAKLKGGIDCCLMATVVRVDGNTQVLYVEQLP